MWSREQLLHPATLIACAALFISLGGVTYAATTIGTRQIRNNAVTSAKLHRSAVTTSKIATRAVTNAKLGRGAVSGDRIADAAITNPKLGNGAVTAGKLADGAVTNGKLADASVTTGKLASGAVTVGKLGDASVTTGKLGGASVTTSKLADGSVTTSKLADGSVTGAKLAAGTAVAGVGTLRQTRLTLSSGQSGVNLMNFPFLGEIEGSCAAGVATTQFHNLSGTNVNVQDTGVDNGAPDTAFTDRNDPADGQTVIAPNGGNGPQQVEWQASLGNGAAAHVGTAWVTSGADLTSCVITVQALLS